MSIYHVEARRKDPEKYRARDRQYYAADRERRLRLDAERRNTDEWKAARRAYIERNREAIKAKRAIYNKAHPPTERDRLRTNEWKTSDRGREWGRKQYTDKWGRDVIYTLKLKLRTRLRMAVKQRAKSSGSAVKGLGCTVEALRDHLEKQFMPGMNWNNWNRTGWHIDHIRPLAKFDLTDPVQLAEACNYSNLQPLWARDNLRKGKRVKWMGA